MGARRAAAGGPGCRASRVTPARGVPAHMGATAGVQGGWAGGRPTVPFPSTCQPRAAGVTAAGSRAPHTWPQRRPEGRRRFENTDSSSLQLSWKHRPATAGAGAGPARGPVSRWASRAPGRLSSRRGSAGPDVRLPSLPQTRVATSRCGPPGGFVCRHDVLMSPGGSDGLRPTGFTCLTSHPVTRADPTTEAAERRSRGVRAPLHRVRSRPSARGGSRSRDDHGHRRLRGPVGGLRSPLGKAPTGQSETGCVSARIPPGRN